MRDDLMAYVDGELDAAARAGFEAELAADAGLRTAVARERALRATLAAAYDPVLDEPLPAALQAALSSPAASAEVVDLAAARAARPSAVTGRRWHWPEWGAMAACLALGIALGVEGLPFGPGGRAGPDTVARRADGALVAQGALERVLTTSLAADAPAVPGIAAGLSFNARDGRTCRSFAIDGTTALAGLACRDGGAWQVRALMPGAGSAASTGGYRMAATALPPALLQLVDTLRDGEVFDAAAERAARDRGWQL
jgi:hypothetical protein